MSSMIEEFLGRASDWLIWPALVALLLCFLLIPLIAWKRTRDWSCVAVLFSSYTIGFYAFVLGCYVTLHFLGGFWFVVVFLFLGVGPVLVGTITLLWHAMYADATVLAVSVGLAYAWRFVALYVSGSLERSRR